MGQYGKQNPLFMYQGTEGVSLRAAAVYSASALAVAAAPTDSGTALCASTIPAPAFRGTMGISLTAALVCQGQAEEYTAAPEESGVARCGDTSQT